MHETTALYQTILADRNHRKEVKLVIAGETYTEKEIISCIVSGALFDKPGIGGCASRQIDFQIYPKATAIPRQAQIEVFVRLVLGTQVSEWIPKGVFFFANRRRDKRTGVLAVKGYDAMLKAETVWLTDAYDLELWPMSQAAAAADIAVRMGVELDSRTALPSGTAAADHPVDYPVDETGDLTMREVLAGIAVANAGNWIITDAGALRLIGYGSIPTETNYLVTDRGSAILIGGARIVIG